MFPEQKGFALVSAIFLLVVLAALGAFMVNFSGVQHVTHVQDLDGTRAYWAARSGIEWGVARAVNSSACTASQNLSGPNGFAVTVTCSSGSHVEGATAVTAYEIIATACNPANAGTCPNAGAVGGLGYVERQLRASVSK